MHYFIEYGNLPTQIASDTFGPDTSSPTTLFHITSRFQLTSDSKAFACQTGELFVQQSDQHTDLVNIVLKPQTGLKIGFRSVLYYVYRGIKKSDFLSGSNITTTNQTEFITRLWNNHNSYKTKINNMSLADPDPEVFGYDSSLSGTTLLSKVFRCGVDAKPRYTKEGEEIGRFTSAAGQKIGFEVILSSDTLELDVNFARQAYTDVDVSSLSGLAERMEREAILDGIDPAAFFGLHLYDGVDVSTYPGGTKTTTSMDHQTLFTNLINPFETRHRLYIDIRSEKGRSYNFYDNYGSANNHLKLGNNSNTPSIVGYEESGWPIKFYDTVSNTTHFRTKIRLHTRIDDNTVPLVYSMNKWNFDTEKESRYYGRSDILDTGNWSKELIFYVPNTGTGTAKNNVAYVLNFDYFRQEYNSTLAGDVQKNEFYYDSAFCSIDIPELGTTGLDVQHLQSNHLNYIRQPLQTDGTGHFGYVANCGAYWDTQRVLFYSAKVDAMIRSGKRYLNTFEKSLGMDEFAFTQSKLNRNLETICFEYERTVSGSAHTFRIPGINHYNADDLDNKEHCLLLGITQAQLTAIKATTGLNSLYNRHIFLDPSNSNPQADNNGHRYFEYTLKLQGLDNSGNQAIVTPQISGSSLTLYSRDNVFFSSEGFGALESLTTGNNEIQFHIYHNGCIKVNDNRDLSLLHQTANNILSERIYYKYHSADNTTASICNLEATQIPELANGTKKWTSIPTGYNTPYFTHDASNQVDAKRSYTYPNNDIRTDGKTQTWHRLYAATGKRAFLVHFEESLVDNTNPTIIFTWNTDTRRYYFKPEYAAAFIGVLVEVGFEVKSSGCSYPTGACFPSSEHVNGKAVDISYKNVKADDDAIIAALGKFGFGEILKGNQTYHYSLTGGTPDTKTNLHNNHLHNAELTLNDCNVEL